MLGTKRYRYQPKEIDPEIIEVAALNKKVIVIIYLYGLYFIFTKALYIYRKLLHQRLLQRFTPPLKVATALCSQAM